MERVECRQLFGKTVLLLGQVLIAGYDHWGREGEGGEECHQGTEVDQQETPWVSELRQNVGNEKRSSKIWKMVGKMESSSPALFQAVPWHTRCPNQYPQPSHEQVMFFS